MKTVSLLCAICLLLLGCAQHNVSPGMTFLVGLNQYQASMAALANRPERWFDRQRLGQSLKATHLVTIGGSREFNRLVDLDVRRKEFLVTLREGSLRPERAKEIREELLTIQRNMDDLKPVVQAQLQEAELRTREQPQRIEAIASSGLLHMALDAFVSADNVPSAPVPSVDIAQHTVIDQGSTTLVRTPEGKNYRCTTLLIQEAGAAMKCESPEAK
jgi:hypothetical protein